MKRIFLIMFLFAFTFTSTAFCKEDKQEKTESLYEQLELFADTITIIQSEFVDEVDTKKLIYGAMTGMLSSLDSYSQFMDPDTYNEIKVETRGEFGGLGIEISIKDGMLTIITPLDGTPAYEAGLKPGDKIVKIDGEITKDITLIDAVKKLRGKPGTKVTVTILREGAGQLLDFTITRAIIKLESIKKAQILEDKIGYIKLVEFQENTPKDLEDNLKKLEEEKMDALILDLRNNPGGLLDVCIKVADKFIGGNEVIVTTKGRMPSQNLEFRSHEGATHPQYPLVVLVNEGSASASEIVAGAIQDHKRGIILGAKTFGKGSVQTIVPLEDGSALRLTTSRYFTPSGRQINEKGIIPDVIVDLEPEKYKLAKEKEDVFEALKTPQALERLKEIIGWPKEKKEEELAQTEKAKEKEFIYDNQLIRAIDLLKGIKVYQSILEKS